MRMSRKPQKSPGRKLDLTAMREALEDRRCWACLGIVRKGDDGNHFELTSEDVLVEVELVPSERHITARLGAVSGGAGRGVWAIPAVGTEVAVLVPDGEYECGPIIVATLSTGEVPSDLDETVVVMSNNLGDIAIIPSGDLSLGVKGATEQAVRGNSFQSRFNAFVQAYNTHMHPTAGLGPPTPPTVPGIPSNAADLSTNVKVS